MKDEPDLSLGEATRRFLANLAAGESRVSQPEIYKFVRWFGGERPLAQLSGTEIAHYVERLSLSDTDYCQKIELIRAFLLWVKKEGWSKTNLATHLKPRKGKTGSPSSSRAGLPSPVLLTRSGYMELEAELNTLRSQRSEVIDEMRKAAADKDFRENAPLQAAREQRGHVEGRIMELEAMLKSAVVIDEKAKATLKVEVGDSLVLRDLDSDQEMRFTLVSPREVDPAKGKISSASPIGRAIIGRNEGETVEVVAPAGKLRYQIKQVKR